MIRRPTSFTTTDTEAVVVPPVLVAVTVKLADLVWAVGVPEIFPLAVVKLSPVGSDPLSEYVTWRPVTLAVVEQAEVTVQVRVPGE